MSEPARRVSESVHRAASALRYHRHGLSFATVVLEGSYIEVRDDIPHTHATGSIVIHDANEEHADYFTSPGRCLNVILDDQPFDDEVRAFCSGRDRAFANATLGLLHTRLNAATHASPPSPPDWLGAALERFDWVADGPLRDAAELVGIHQTHFSREFHRHVGMTPNDYRRRSRVRRASELLLATSARIVNIAQACGYNDQSHLTRAFSVALGLSPAAYRRTFTR